jgi:hypothetical protein
MDNSDEVRNIRSHFLEEIAFFLQNLYISGSGVGIMPCDRRVLINPLHDFDQIAVGVFGRRDHL